MNQSQPLTVSRNTPLLLFIIAVYLIIFVLALGTSCYLLNTVIQLKPILLIALLKYTLLSAIFLILLVNGLKALTLKEAHLLGFENSIKNFKWLFIIALIIAVAAKFGFFSKNISDAGSKGSKPTEIAYLHIVLLTAAAVFCTWSYGIIAKINLQTAESKKRPSSVEDGL